MGRFLLACVVSLLVSCATPIVQDEPGNTVNLSATWQTSGKILITHQQQSSSAYFRWHRLNVDHDEIVLSGPLHLGAQTFTRFESSWFAKIQESIQPLPRESLPPEGAWLTHLSGRQLAGIALGKPEELPVGVDYEVRRWMMAQGFRVPALIKVSSADGQIRMAFDAWVFQEDGS
jgi:hypothetical protein